MAGESSKRSVIAENLNFLSKYTILNFVSCQTKYTIFRFLLLTLFSDFLRGGRNAGASEIGDERERGHVRE